MKKICLSVVGLYLMMLQALGQTTPSDTTYKPKKLSLSEVNLVSGYYSQTADKSAVMGGRTDAKGNGDLTDISNSLEVKFVGMDKYGRKQSVTAGFGIDHHTAASQAYVDSNGHARRDGTRKYPTVDWSVENKEKGSEFGMGAYYSAEHNYYHSVGGNIFVDQKTKTNGEFNIKLTGFFDNMKLIRPAEFVPVDSIKNVAPHDSIVYLTTASGHIRQLVYHNGGIVGSSDGKTPVSTAIRNTITASFSFAQVINKRLQASLALDLVFMKGYLGLPFHRVYLNNGRDTIENLPDHRFKLPVGLRLNYFLGDHVVLRGYYRFYLDNWGIRSHTASLEIPVKITPFFSLSPFYRYYVQTAARYFAPYGVHNSKEEFFTSNYALAAFSSNYFGLGMRLAPPKGIFKGLAVMELRYGHYTQTTNLAADGVTMSLQFK